MLPTVKTVGYAFGLVYIFKDTPRFSRGKCFDEHNNSFANKGTSMIFTVRTGSTTLYNGVVGVKDVVDPVIQRGKLRY